MSAATKPIVNLSRENVLCETTVIADSARRRMRGLLGRASLSSGEGMLLLPAPSIHTAFMRFPIDVVFADRQLQVIKIAENLLPWRTSSARHARLALELPAGEARRRQVEVGDQLAIGVAEKRHFSDGDADDPQDGKARIRRRSEALAELEPPPFAGHPDLVSGSGANWSGTTPANSDGLRVLLVGDDRRFRAVATTLLERRGFRVAVAERPALAEPASLPAADVIVLDAGDSLTRAAEEAAKVAGAVPGIGVVCVAERPRGSVTALPVLPKWGSFDALIAAIEQASSHKDDARADVRR